uniref:JAB1/MPN/MOV34 metalloenzyme domain-containing protein n=1 Tax=Ditylenchus dipsaci TaxID=166011 RepID=A0A915EHL3_9BILA
MASSLTVKVHPVVYMTMVDSYERRSQKAACNNRALGTLLGFYEKNVVQVTNCYAIPFREAPDGQTPEINDSFNQQMWQVAKRAAPSETILPALHIYYTHLIGEISVKKELPPVILLTMDLEFRSKDTGFYFPALKVVLDAFHGENVALGFITKGIDSERREIQLDQGLDQLEDSADKMVNPELLADSTIGRKLMQVVTDASTQLQPEKLESLVKNSLRDYMMVSYISHLAKTQLSLQEKMLSLLQLFWMQSKKARGLIRHLSLLVLSPSQKTAAEPQKGRRIKEKIYLRRTHLLNIRLKCCLNQVLRSGRPDIDRKQNNLLKLQGNFSACLR